MNENWKFKRQLLWLTVFAIAMAYMESAVVVYLREIFYPEGFRFPLHPVTGPIAVTEVIREAATIIMLISLGYIAGKNFHSRFAWFIYAFAIWDIFYYVFLKLLLNWPSSFLSWDILFLIPVMWVGPVLCPVILSLTMILFAMLILQFENKGIKTKIRLMEWLLFIGGSLVVIISFTLDYAVFILHQFTLYEIWAMAGSDRFYKLAMQYLPVHFNWWIFLVGEGIILTGIACFNKRNIKIQ